MKVQAAVFVIGKNDSFAARLAGLAGFGEGDVAGGGGVAEAPLAVEEGDLLDDEAEGDGLRAAVRDGGVGGGGGLDADFCANEPGDGRDVDGDADAVGV